jgi:1-acyl-sn-glycerol-3-phosphate acyltransferase
MDKIRGVPVMKASVFKKLWIIIVSVTSTLSICFLVFYLRLTRTYNREYADSVLRWWSGVLLRAVGATWEVNNTHNVTIKPGRPYIIMANHRSYYDIPLSFVSLPGSIRMLAKKEFFKVPIWGEGMKAAEFIFIDRNNLEQALKDLDEARIIMQSGIVLWVAPEGTRSRTGRLQDFKKGGFMLALQTGAVIIPVGIKGSETILPPDTFDFVLGRKIEVNIGEPIDASLYNSEQRDDLMQNVRHAIEGLSGERK